MTEDKACFRTYFDRERDVLIAVGDPDPLVRDLELHLLASDITHDAFTTKRLRDGLSALALYMVCRPGFETSGWTISLQEPPLNLFFTGSAREETVVGRAFIEGVEPSGKNLFYAETGRDFGGRQRSAVDVEGSDVFRIVEQYCARSDQQSARFFFDGEGGSSGGKSVALLSSLPDADLEWFQAVGGEEIFSLVRDGSLKLISERRISFHCGCDTDRITKVVVDLYKDVPEDLFRGDPDVEAECPRCGTKHRISRQSFEKFLSG